MAGFDPSQPRDQEGQWTKAEQSARMSAFSQSLWLDENGRPLPSPEKVWHPGGIGSVPAQQGEEYYGRYISLTPSEYLDKTPPVPYGRETDLWMESQIKIGTKLANPFLEVDWNGNFWEATGHEGRNRMIAFRRLYGDLPVRVMLLFNNGMRARDVSDEMLKQWIKPQTGSR